MRILDKAYYICPPEPYISVWKWCEFLSSALCAVIFPQSILCLVKMCPKPTCFETQWMQLVTSSRVSLQFPHPTNPQRWKNPILVLMLKPHLWFENICRSYLELGKQWLRSKNALLPIGLWISEGEIKGGLDLLYSFFFLFFSWSTIQCWSSLWFFYPFESF